MSNSVEFNAEWEAVAGTRGNEAEYARKARQTLQE